MFYLRTRLAAISEVFCNIADEVLSWAWALRSFVLWHERRQVYSLAFLHRNTDRGIIVAVSFIRKPVGVYAARSDDQPLGPNAGPPVWESAGLNTWSCSPWHNHSQCRGGGVRIQNFKAFKSNLNLKTIRSI